MVSEEEQMGLAEKVGRLILFPLSWIDQANTRRARDNVRRQQEREERERLENEEREQEERRAKTEQAAAEKAARELQQTQMENEQRSRAERVRYECQLLYDRHEFQIREKFPQEKLDRYFAEYMKDEFPVDVIEKRGDDLKSMIQSFSGGGGPKLASPAQIRAQFDEQRAQLKALDLEASLLEAQMSELNYREDQAIQELLRNQ